MDITPSGQTLGARITDIDLANPLPDSEFRSILRALGEHGVLCFPRQTLDTDQLAAFGRRFGELEINVANAYHEPNHPEMMILSNIKQNGKQIGANDAGQGWHTDMSYSHDIALANILHARHVPMRNGKPLGETQFRNMHAAYDDLPDALKHRLEGRTATHDFAKFWDMMVAKPGSTRKPLTPEQRAKKPPVSQPIFRRHPITGRFVLYANVGYTMFIDGMDEQESGEILDFLFRHQERAEYLHAHHWSVGDVLMWDNIGTVHNAVGDYTADEPRYMRRVQVMATLDYPRPGGMTWPSSRASASSSPVAPAASASRPRARCSPMARTSCWWTSTTIASRRLARHSAPRASLPGSRRSTRRKSCAAALDSAGAPVAALIHLAGLFERDPFDPNDHGVWNRAIAANLTNAYDLAVAFATRYDNRDGPARIVLTSSVAYRRGSAGYPPYAAAKAGLVGLTRSLARRLAPDVLVNAVAPGLIDTRMAVDTIAERGEAYKNEIPVKRYGHPAEVASVIRFLCSRDSSYVNGQTITVDGGITNA